MVRFYITRHGETVWNTEKRMQGHKDSALTEKGIRQARLLSAAMDDMELAAVHSSSSGRTMQTARIITEGRDIPIIPEDDLREIHLGEWEGLIFSEAESRYPEQYRNFWELPHLYKPVGGEELPELRNRLERILNRLAMKYDGKSVLVVTHAVALKTIMAIVENKEWKEFWSGAFIHPTSMSVVEQDCGKWIALKWGDTSHYELEDR